MRSTAAIALVLSVVVSAQGTKKTTAPPVPLGLLPVVWPSDNPYSPEKADLGRTLFFDKRLSKDDTVSCASCHSPEHAFTDGSPVAGDSGLT